MYVQRKLTALLNGVKHDVVVLLSEPSKIEENNWICEYEITWPDSPKKREVYGFDGVQALYSAMTIISADLYSSEFHKKKSLFWLELGDGFGFPLASSLRDIAEGQDRLL